MATRVEMAEIAMGTGKAQYFDGRYGDGDGDGDGNGDGGIIPPGFFLNFSLDRWDGGSFGDKTEGDGAE